jgi:hypothetical protein
MEVAHPSYWSEVVRLDQTDERVPGHDHLHISQELLAIGLLLEGSLRIVRENLAACAHQYNPSLGSPQDSPLSCTVLQTLHST